MPGTALFFTLDAFSIEYGDFPRLNRHELTANVVKGPFKPHRLDCGMFADGAGVLWRRRVGVENRQREALRSRPWRWLQQPRSDRPRLSVKANKNVHNVHPSIVAVQREESLENSVSPEPVLKRSAGTGYGLSQTKAAATTSRARANATPVLHSGDTVGARIREAAPWLALHLATVLWGTQHAVIKSLVDSGFNASVLNMERFGLASSVFIASALGSRLAGLLKGRTRSAAPEQQRLPQNPRYWRRMLRSWNGAIELGLWMFLGYAFQSVGLANTSASRSSFLLYLNVKIVPFLAAVFLRRRIPRITWISAALALLGTLMLSFDGAPPSIGDAWSVAAACASAVFILRLERVASRLTATEINALSLTTVTVLATLWTTFQMDSSGVVTLDWTSLGSKLHQLTNPAVLYLGLATTALSGWLQALGQERISAERAAIIYALDPVYGAAFAYLVLGETLGTRGIAGALIVFLASLISQGAIRSWLSDIVESRAEREREKAD